MQKCDTDVKVKQKKNIIIKKIPAHISSTHAITFTKKKEKNVLTFLKLDINLKFKKQ